MHTDLFASNFLVYGDFNITGILDWDDLLVCRFPLQVAVRYPAIIGVRDEYSDDELLLKDRLTFVEHLTSSLRSAGFSDDITAQLLRIVADQELQVFQSAIRGKSLLIGWLSTWFVVLNGSTQLLAPLIDFSRVTRRWRIYLKFSPYGPGYWTWREGRLEYSRKICQLLSSYGAPDPFTWANYTKLCEGQCRVRKSIRRMPTASG